MTTNYVGAAVDYKTQTVMVWERPIEGGPRVLKRIPIERYFFVPGDGEYTALDGTQLTKLVFDTEDEFNAAIRQHPRKWESDIPPLFKCLMNNYFEVPSPNLHFAFLDIETNYSSSIGFPAPSTPYAIINAVTIYQSWTQRYLTYVIPPIVNGVMWQGTEADLYQKFDELVANGSLRANQKPEFKILRNEAELIVLMLDAIQDADIISGWNSEFYDLPYIVARIKLILPKLLHKLCFLGAQEPRARQVEKYGSPETVYALSGRTHLDYKDLFDKFTFEGRESLALGNILQEEVGLSKIHYEGTLEQLYHNDFPTFCCYNFRDVSGMVDLDNKFKFIQLVNQMAHENTCLFENILGTVRYVETGIANRAIRVHNVRVPDKVMMTDGEKVEGALVLNPRIGLHEWVGSVDINSLYPSVIRALNISPEKVVGQFLDGEESWKGIKNGDSLPHVLRCDNGETYEATGKEWQQALTDSKWAISAYGTVFDQSSGQGLVPETLTYWYSERKKLQAEKKKWSKEIKKLEALIEKDGHDDQRAAELAHAEKQEALYDLLQLTKKIQLNSAYGALLNKAFRFGRKEMGASVTACGRQITTHMMETIHDIQEPEVAAKIQKSTMVEKDGKISNVYTIDGDTIIYGDTDSVDGASIVRSSIGIYPISELFDRLSVKWADGAKEYATSPGLLSPCVVDGNVCQKPVKAIYRHRVSKPRWKITLENGSSVTVTDDHSIMVIRNGQMIEVKPSAINRDTDVCITIENL